MHKIRRRRSSVGRSGYSMASPDCEANTEVAAKVRGVGACAGKANRWKCRTLGFGRAFFVA